MATPFTIAVPDAVLTDLRERLGRARFPDEPSGAGWQFGSDLAYVKALTSYWREGYDWRRWEAEPSWRSSWLHSCAGTARRSRSRSRRS